MSKLVTSALPCLALLVASACNSEAKDDAVAAPANKAIATESSLPFFGDGFPQNGDACRRVGESAATVDYLDDSADLVGCPSDESARALNGKILTTIDGTVLVSVPRSAATTSAATGDALVAGTDYNATAEIECSGYRKNPPGGCSAGVKRNREGGLTIVEVKWAGGDTRMLMFKDGKVIGANTNQADGSAAHEVVGQRDGDNTIVRIGPERYVIPDAFILGG